MMCGQVKQRQHFFLRSSPTFFGWRRLLLSLATKNTDGLIGGVVRVLKEEGIELVDSTLLLKEIDHPLLAPEGVLTRRKPDSDEARDIEYGRRIAATLSGLDVGQSVAIAERACVAVEAMEGTDAMLRRAASLVEGKPLRLVKASRAAEASAVRRALVVGPGTMEVGCGKREQPRLPDRRGRITAAARSRGIGPRGPTRPVGSRSSRRRRKETRFRFQFSCGTTPWI